MKCLILCKEKITGIVFLKNIQSQTMKHIVSFNLNKRYEQAQNIHGSSVHNRFTQVDGAMEMRLVSADDLHTATEPSFESDIYEAHLNPGLYVACIYDFDCYIGIVTEVEVELNEFKVNFMRTDNKTFSWLHKKDSCWVPVFNCLGVVKKLLAQGHSA